MYLEARKTIMPQLANVVSWKDLILLGETKREKTESIYSRVVCKNVMRLTRLLACLKIINVARHMALGNHIDHEPHGDGLLDDLISSAESRSGPYYEVEHRRGSHQEVSATDKASSQFRFADSGNPMVIKERLQGTFNAFARIGEAKPPARGCQRDGNKASNM
jgi:hypothetical protein